jgi:hypothetical protein
VSFVRAVVRADRPVGCAGAVVGLGAAGRVVVEEPWPPPEPDVDDLDAEALEEDADADFADSLADFDEDFEADDGGVVVDDEEPPSEAPDGEVSASVTGTARRKATTTWRSGRRWTTRTQGWPGTGTSWDATRPPRYGGRVASPGSASHTPPSPGRASVHAPVYQPFNYFPAGRRSCREPRWRRP